MSIQISIRSEDYKSPTNYNLRIKYHKKETYPKFTNFEYASFN